MGSHWNRYGVTTELLEVTMELGWGQYKALMGSEWNLNGVTMEL